MKEVYVGDPEYFQILQRLYEVDVLMSRFDVFSARAPVIVVILFIIATLTRAFVPSPVITAVIVVQFVIVAAQFVVLMKTRSLKNEKRDLTPSLLNAKMPTATIQMIQGEDGVYR